MQEEKLLQSIRKGERLGNLTCKMTKGKGKFGLSTDCNLHFTHSVKCFSCQQSKYQKNGKWYFERIPKINEGRISCFILPAEKFLQSDWL